MQTRLFSNVVVFTSIVALGAVNTVLLRVLKPSSPSPSSAIASFTPTLSCEAIFDLSRWSLDHYGGPAHWELRSAQFAERALEAFLARIDPQKLLFTEPETKRFHRLGAEAWGRFVQSKHCDFFDEWMESDYALAKARFWESTRRIRVGALFPVRTPEKHKEVRAKKYEAYAPDERTLELRLLETIRQIAASTTRSLLRAYDNDRRRYIEDTLSQWLFESQPNPRETLAKALLYAVDPFSTYLSRTEYEDFYADLAGSASGIGIRARRVPEGLFIEKVMDDSPAQRAGLQEGDVICSVDGKSPKSLPPSAAKRLIAGPAGSAVRLVLFREEGVKKVTLVREQFEFEESRIRHRIARTAAGTAVGIVEVPSFYGKGGNGRDDRSSAEDVERLLGEMLRTHRIGGLILDLRGNPGGYLEEAVAMAGLFLGDRVVVGVNERRGYRLLRDAREKPLYEGPITILLDQQSASAAEIFAGALRDHGRAVLVGADRTYGKGSVQKLFHLEDVQALAAYPELKGGVVKLTTSLFYSPLGHSPSNGGVRTDISLLSTRPDVETDSMAPALPAPVAEQRPLLEPEEEVERKARARLLENLLSRLKERRTSPTDGLAASPTDRTQEEAAAITGEWAQLLMREQPASFRATAQPKKTPAAARASFRAVRRGPAAR